jgi:Abnormal spindle-like microcephaly-assoc'd, ASPM-SPD-2-Hydin
MRSLPSYLLLFLLAWAVIHTSDASNAAFAQTDQSAGRLTVSWSSVTFGIVERGKTRSVNEILTNSGGSSVTITSVNVTDTRFSVSEISVPLTLAGGKSIKFSVVFAPPAYGAASGKITITSDASNPLISIPLNGNSVPLEASSRAPNGGNHNHNAPPDTTAHNTKPHNTAPHHKYHHSASEPPTKAGFGLEGKEQDFLSKIKPGTIVFDVPDEMVQGEEKVVQVRIARSVAAELQATMKQGMTPAAKTEVIKVAQFMTATLHSNNNSAFPVTQLSEDEQAVSDDDFTTWTWNVQPLESGQQQLFLDVATRFKIPGSKDEFKFIPTLHRVINVHVDRMFATKHFVGQEWKYLLGGIGSIIVFLAGLTTWKKKTKGTVLNP